MSKIEQEQTERTPGLEERFEAIEQILDQMENADVSAVSTFPISSIEAFCSWEFNALNASSEVSIKGFWFDSFITDYYY